MWPRRYNTAVDRARGMVGREVPFWPAHDEHACNGQLQRKSISVDVIAQTRIEARREPCLTLLSKRRSAMPWRPARQSHTHSKNILKSTDLADLADQQSKRLRLLGIGEGRLSAVTILFA